MPSQPNELRDAILRAAEVTYEPYTESDKKTEHIVKINLNKLMRLIAKDCDKQLAEKEAAMSNKQANELRILLEGLSLEIGQQVTDWYVLKHGLWEGLSIQNVQSINKYEKLIHALHTENLNKQVREAKYDYALKGAEAVLKDLANWINSNDPNLTALLHHISVMTGSVQLKKLTTLKAREG